MDERLRVEGEVIHGALGKSQMAKELTAEQQSVLLDVTRFHLEIYGYLSGERSASRTKPTGAAASVGNVETLVGGKPERYVERSGRDRQSI